MEYDCLNNKIILEDMDVLFQSRADWKELDNSKIYITGAAGMIASYFVMFLIYLNEYKHCNINIYAGIRNIEKAKKRYGKYIEREYFHLIASDVTQPFNENVELDYIVHAASFASPQYYGCSPVETMLPNIIGTHELLKWATQHPVRSFLFFSSDTVYGTVKDVEQISEEVVGTLDFLAKGNVYGESKRCGETLCRAYYNEYGIPAKSARIYHTYAPTMDINNDKRVFSEFVRNILNNESIVLKSDGKAKRAFSYVTDTVSALYRILLDGENGESYNVGNNNEFVSIRELAEQLVAIFPEKKLKVIVETRNDTGYSSSPESHSIPLCIEKTKKLGWQPKITIKDGFYRTICYLQQLS